MKNKKGNVVVIAIIIIVVSITASIITWLFIKKTQQTQSTQTQVEIKTPQQPIVSTNQTMPAEKNEAEKKLIPADLVYEINDKFIKPLNKSVNYSNSASVEWIKEDGKIICLNYSAHGFILGQKVGLAKAVKIKTDNEISAYLKSLGFSENKKNTARGENGAGTIGFEKDKLKCKLSNYALNEDGFDYNLACAEYTEEDQKIFDEFFPLLYKNDYPRSFFCLKRLGDNYVAGGASSLDKTDNMSYGGASIFGIKENGKWETVITQDILDCSFAKRLPKSIGIEKCWDDTKQKEIDL